MEKIILQTTRETLMKFSKKHLVSTAFILVLLLSISFPLYAEEAELTLEALAEKIEELFAGQDDLASTVEELAERVEELETRVCPNGYAYQNRCPYHYSNYDPYTYCYSNTDPYRRPRQRYRGPDCSRKCTLRARHSA